MHLLDKDDLPGGALPLRSTYPTRADVVGAVIVIALVAGFVTWILFVIVQGVFFPQTNGSMATTSVADNEEE